MNPLRLGVETQVVLDPMVHPNKVVLSIPARCRGVFHGAEAHIDIERALRTRKGDCKSAGENQRKVTANMLHLRFLLYLYGIRTCF